MTRYSMRDESGWHIEFEAESLQAAVDRALEILENGDWEAGDKTYWPEAGVYEIDGVGNETGNWFHVKTQIDPEEPPCVAGRDHDWQSPHAIVGGLKENPGVRGHGGGVIINECCMHCGCRKTVDTWATGPNGEQGLDTVEYEPDCYALELSQMIGESR